MKNSSIDLFNQPPIPSNYSYETSLPAYHSHKQHKYRQQDYIYNIIEAMIENGIEVTLLHIEEKTNIPQARISARINDMLEHINKHGELIKGRVRYEGTTYYKGSKRKRILLTNNK